MKSSSKFATTFTIICTIICFLWVFVVTFFAIGPTESFLGEEMPRDEFVLASVRGIIAFLFFLVALATGLLVILLYGKKWPITKIRISIPRFLSKNRSA